MTDCLSLRIKAKHLPVSSVSPKKRPAVKQMTWSHQSNSSLDKDSSASTFVTPVSVAQDVLTLHTLHRWLTHFVEHFQIIMHRKLLLTQPLGAQQTYPLSRGAQWHSYNTHVKFMHMYKLSHSYLIMTEVMLFISAHDMCTVHLRAKLKNDLHSSRIQGQNYPHSVALYI